MEFSIFKTAVAKQFEVMKKHDLFRVSAVNEPGMTLSKEEVDAKFKDLMWATYLGSFPAGSDPIYKTRTEHDCNCCKQFIRAVGNVVAVIDGKIVSIWDIDAGNENYQAVADALAALVKSKPIVDTFLHYEPVAGTNKNFQDTIDGVKTWEHFFINIPPQYVVKGSEISSTLSETRSQHDVLLRTLNEITVDAIHTVQELIAQNTLYRGEEHSFIVDSILKLKKQFAKVKPEDRDAFIWTQIKKLPASVAKGRNTVIGTLLTDLSNEVDLEDAVKMYESKVAPANYKRPTALVTKAMVERAKKTIEELGLTSALERRYATINDITINNILFANRDARVSMNADVFDEIASKVSDKLKSLDKVDEVPIEKFIKDILPKAESIELMFENSHIGNLVSLIAPVDPTAKQLFKWNNGFSWSYNGEFADSIKQRVKAAGGNVTGDLCCRLAWYNFDDLDFHMIEPDGYEIYFGNRRRNSPSYGQLDVDMNGCDGKNSREPVENIVYANKDRMKEGVYRLMVNQYSQRESIDVGFEVEMDFMGTVYHFTQSTAARGKTLVVEFRFSKKNGIEFIKSMNSSKSVAPGRDAWGITTNSFQKVNVMMMSPNFWDDLSVGNKHYFFMLENCKNEDKARGFFNEFLKSELDAHRKVIEVVGSKMRTDESDQQLSGLGFSSTQRNSVLCKVKGSFSRIIKIVF